MLFSSRIVLLCASALLQCLPGHAVYTGEQNPGLPFFIRPQPPRNNGKVCTVWPRGNRKDDVPQIMSAFERCNYGGTVVFPEHQTYWIGQKIHPTLYDVTIDWKGTWLFSDDIKMWRNNTYHIDFQNHWTAFPLSGERIYINGYGTGGINGNGNAWYNVEKGFTQPGRPMAFTPWNITELVVQHFSVIDSPLWSISTMNGTNCWWDDIYVNATAVNAPFGDNWVQNTDGFDTMDSYNIALTNFVYQGGDDAIAIKPRSYGIFIQNATIHGGNGIAVGSLGQYLDDATVENILVRDVNILTHNNDMHNSAYIKTWVGELVPQDPSDNGWYESGGVPRGAGWGMVNNVRFENFYIEGAGAAAQISQDSGDNGSFPGTSNMLVTNVAFVNFTGWLNSTKDTNSGVSCSNRNPCYNIDFRNFSVSIGQDGTPSGAKGSCSYTEPGGVHGLSGCS